MIFFGGQKRFLVTIRGRYTPNQSDIYKKCENCYIISGDNKLAIYLRYHLDQLPHEQTLCHQ